MDGVGLVNALGARWGRELAGGAGQVWTAVGVWPLLGMLAGGADPVVARELAVALGLPAEQAPSLAREVIAALRRVPGCAAALGLWTADALAVEPGWAALVGPSVWGRLSGDLAADQRMLDEWAATETGGLIPELPVRIKPATLLVLASAVTVRTRWARAFKPVRLRPGSGPWAGRWLAGLSLEGSELFERIAVAETAAGPVTEVRVAGDGEVDVHLLLGAPDAPLDTVAAAGFELLAGTAVRVPVAELPDGAQWPGLALESVGATRPGDRGALRTVAFEVRADHDLLARPALFGLETACAEGGFPGICSTTPLRVSQARQSAMAAFTDAGFEAGAVTVVAMTRSAAMAPPAVFRVRRAELRLERPFAFLAVHRPTGLALMAGWVTEPRSAE
ncbi:serpin family protein [Kitasatospora sp. NPDC049285]|uniref:serpin family protein n=1 Tax=Kitasatospora sp. NPDC049285 TaxID=3157096 RepID=UPI0034202E58